MAQVLVAPASLGSHISAMAVAEAAARGLERAGWEPITAPLASGEPGTAESLVRCLGGRMRSEAVSGKPPVRWGMLADGTAVMDRGTLEAPSTYGLGVAIRSAHKHQARRLLICMGGVQDTDLGRGMFRALGASISREDRLLSLPTGLLSLPIAHLFIQTPTVTVLSRRASRWLESLETWAQDPVAHLSGEMGPAMAVLGAQPRPAVSYLASTLKLDDQMTAVRWILSAAPLAGALVPGSTLTWVAQFARFHRRPVWALVPQMERGFERLYRLGPLGLYPLLDRLQSERQASRRTVVMIEQAAFRLGMYMAGDLADSREPNSGRDSRGL